MEFKTIDSKIFFDKQILIIKKIKNNPNKEYWFHSFILIGIFIAFQVDKAIHEKPLAWVIVLVALTWIYPHLERIFKFLFVYKWGNRIRINEITEIITLPIENELETTLMLKLNSGRKKLFIFRTAEKQVEGFIDLLQQLQSTQLSISNGYS